MRIRSDFVEREVEIAEELDGYFRTHPNSFAARIKPLAVRAGAGWQIFHGPEIPGASVFGWTLASAFESWEANYREAVTAQQ